MGFRGFFVGKKVVREKTGKKKKKKKKKKRGAESSLNRITQSSTQSGQETAQRSQNQGSLQEIGTQGGGGEQEYN